MAVPLASSRSLAAPKRISARSDASSSEVSAASVASASSASGKGRAMTPFWRIG